MIGSSDGDRRMTPYEKDQKSVYSDTPLICLYTQLSWNHRMKTIKFRIEPNSEQRKIIDQMVDANRLVYNNMVTACKLQYEK
ncbi:MAG: helix-turn-helix domain-containing protein, partial [Candidatus Methanomethylophilaceae archaeon]|nr:helix-turn-helix domain-containing protein [Candidatus Methanomethylophilaceae archaeon]